MIKEKPKMYPFIEVDHKQTWALERDDFDSKGRSVVWVNKHEKSSLNEISVGYYTVLSSRVCWVKIEGREDSETMKGCRSALSESFYIKRLERSEVGKKLEKPVYNFMGDSIILDFPLNQHYLMKQLMPAILETVKAGISEVFRERILSVVEELKADFAICLTNTFSLTPRLQDTWEIKTRVTSEEGVFEVIASRQNKDIKFIGDDNDVQYSDIDTIEVNCGLGKENGAKEGKLVIRYRQGVSRYQNIIEVLKRFKGLGHKIKRYIYETTIVFTEKVNDGFFSVFFPELIEAMKDQLNDVVKKELKELGKRCRVFIKGGKKSKKCDFIELEPKQAWALKRHNMGNYLNKVVWINEHKKSRLKKVKVQCNIGDGGSYILNVLANDTSCFDECRKILPRSSYMHEGYAFEDAPISYDFMGKLLYMNWLSDQHYLMKQLMPEILKLFEDSISLVLKENILSTLDEIGSEYMICLTQSSVSLISEVQDSWAIRAKRADKKDFCEILASEDNKCEGKKEADIRLIGVRCIRGEKKSGKGEVFLEFRNNLLAVEINKKIEEIKELGVGLKVENNYTEISFNRDTNYKFFLIFFEIIIKAMEGQMNDLVKKELQELLGRGEEFVKID